MSIENNNESKIPSESELPLSKADSGNYNKKSSSSIEKISDLPPLSDCQIFNEDNIYGKKLSPDSRLINWDKWLNIHRKQQDKLSNSLKRPANCLVMNMNLHNLYVNQEKQLITEASNYELVDKYRGYTGFWISDNSFKSEGRSLGVYQPIQKRYDRSRLTNQKNWCPAPKELEYVDVPDAIYRIKGLSEEPCLPLPKDNWNKSEYVFKRKELLRDKLSLFQKHKPQAEKLAIIGAKYIPIKKKLYEQREDEEEMFEQEFKQSNEFSVSDEGTVSTTTSKDLETSVIYSINVSIDNEIIESHNKEWDVIFGDCRASTVYKKHIIITNLNDCCLRYSWEPVVPPWIASTLPLKRLVSQGQYFYFNRNPAVILPKSNVKIFIYFEPDKAGLFSEKWNLFTSNVPDKKESITVTFQGVVSEKLEHMENLKTIESYIESCTKFTTATKTVKEIIERTGPDRIADIPYDWKFFEEQVFIFNNPDLFYDSKYVLLLKEMFKQLGEGPWDYSVESIRKKLSQKSFNEDVTNEINQYTSIVCHLAKPKMTFPIANEIYKSVYELLCYFADRIEEEGNNLKYIFQVPTRNSSFQEDGSSIQMFRSPVKGSKNSQISIKLNTRNNNTSKKSKSSFDKNPFNEQMQYSLSRKSWTLSSQENNLYSDLQMKMKKQEYLEALYVKTYHYLCKTVDNITAIIESFDVLKKKSVFKSLKSNMLT